MKRMKMTVANLLSLRQVTVPRWTICSVSTRSRSRFNYFQYRRLYTEQLYEILLTFAKVKKYIMSDDAAEVTRKCIKAMYDSRD